MRFLGGGAAWNHVAMEQAIADAGLEAKEISNERTGIIMGSGGPSTRTIVEAADIARTKGPKRVGPFAVPKAMSSTASATLATWFKIKGVNYSISSACATSNHCIGNAYEIIQMGKQDIIFAGGCEELDWTLSVLFDAMGAMSSNFNDTPDKASRAYDVDRDGFVIAGGAGVLVLEELEHAKARGARIYARGRRLWRDLRRLRHGGAVGRRRGALHEDGALHRQGAGRLHQSARDLDADRRPQGDRGDPRSVRRQMPPISATKSLTGHSLGRRRRAGGDLFAADDEQRLHLRERQHREARSGLRRHADRARAPRQRDARLRAVELVRLRRHQRLDRVQAAGCVTPGIGFRGTEGRGYASGLMKGKRGLIMGVANDHSIAWGIARRSPRRAPTLAFTYQGEALGKRVKPLAAVARLRPRAAVRRRGHRLGRRGVRRDRARPGARIDFLVHAIAYSDKNELKGRYADTTRANFVRTMVISCFSFTEVGEARRGADAERRRHGDAHLQRRRCARCRTTTSWASPRPRSKRRCAISRSISAASGIRVNAISAGPIRTLAGAGISDARFMFAFQQRHSPLRRGVTLDELGGAALYLLSDLSTGVTGEIHFVDSGYNVISPCRIRTR